jgi:hypothetical protein
MNLIPINARRKAKEINLQTLFSGYGEGTIFPIVTDLIYSNSRGLYSGEVLISNLAAEAIKKQVHVNFFE